MLQHMIACSVYFVLHSFVLINNDDYYYHYYNAYPICDIDFMRFILSVCDCMTGEALACAESPTAANVQSTSLHSVNWTSGATS